MTISKYSAHGFAQGPRFPECSFEEHIPYFMMSEKFPHSMYLLFNIRSGFVVLLERGSVTIIIDDFHDISFVKIFH
jgi:hypothetical protein